MLRLLSYNIRFGGRGREDSIARVIRRAEPDVVIFQEASDPRVVQRLAHLTEMSHWGARRGYSTGFLSRLPLAASQWHQISGARHAVLELLPQQSELRIFGLHLSARFSRWSEARRAREIGALFHTVHDMRGDNHVLVGDFNTLAPGERLDVSRMPAWIRALIWISGRDIQRQTIGRILDEGYVDGFRHCYPDTPGYTFPVWDPHLRLDYLFVPDTRRQILHRMRVLDDDPEAATASDHFPLLALLER